MLSELRRKQPNEGVISWFEERPATTLYISVLTLGEIHKGIEKLADSRHKRQLLDWLETDLPAFFMGRVLTIDEKVADHWGHITATTGRPVPAIDSLLASTALSHNLAMMTRNVNDYFYPGLEVINPWNDGV